MKINGNTVRTGMVIDWQSRLWVVTKNQACKPGKGGAYNQVELKDVLSGTKNNTRFNSDEKVERVRLEASEYTYLFADGDMLTFMDSKSYEQIQLSADLVGDDLPFLQDNMVVTIGTHEGKPISIEIPEKVIMTVLEADPVVKGQTVTSSYKPAVLENDVRIGVPPFIEVGTRIVVDTRDRTYVERAKD